MRATGQIIGALVIIFMMGAMMTGINSFRGSSYTDTFNVTTTNGTTTTVTLSQELLDDLTSNAVISSNHTDDAPVPSTYTSATRQLAIGGLATSTQRMLTVEYSYPALSTYWAADTGARIWPMLMILGVIALVTGAVIVSVRRE